MFMFYLFIQATPLAVSQYVSKALTQIYCSLNMWTKWSDWKWSSVCGTGASKPSASPKADTAIQVLLRDSYQVLTHSEPRADGQSLTLKMGRVCLEVPYCPCPRPWLPYPKYLPQSWPHLSQVTHWLWPVLTFPQSLSSQCSLIPTQESTEVLLYKESHLQAV